MDPLTQGVVGSLAARTFVGQKSKNPIAIAFLGGLSALTPDLDVLIKSSTDHLLFLQYHRQFSHSLFFIPFGALFCSLIIWPLVRFKRICNFKTCLLACLAGFATHGLIDACTTYGTVLFWPFANTRIAWSIISIIDPIFTLTIIFGLIASVFRSSLPIALFTVLFSLLYLLLGFYQNQRVQAEVYEIAIARNHTVESVFVKPSFGNLIVWRTVYLHDNRFYVDAIRAGKEFTRFDGGSVKRFIIDEQSQKLEIPSLQFNDLKRFDWFTSNMLGVSELYPDRVIDVRYSILPNGIDPIWYLEFNEDVQDNRHLTFNTIRSNSWAKLKKLTFMIFGTVD